MRKSHKILKFLDKRPLIGVRKIPRCAHGTVE